MTQVNIWPWQVRNQTSGSFPILKAKPKLRQFQVVSTFYKGSTNCRSRASASPQAGMLPDSRGLFEGCPAGPVLSSGAKASFKDSLTPPPPQQATCQIPHCGPCPDTLPEATRPVCRAWMALASPLTYIRLGCLQKPPAAFWTANTTE